MMHMRIYSTVQYSTIQYSTVQYVSARAESTSLLLIFLSVCVLVYIGINNTLSALCVSSRACVLQTRESRRNL